MLLISLFSVSLTVADDNEKNFLSLIAELIFDVFNEIWKNLSSFLGTIWYHLGLIGSFVYDNLKIALLFCGQQIIHATIIFGDSSLKSFIEIRKLINTTSL